MLRSIPFIFLDDDRVEAMAFYRYCSDGDLTLEIPVMHSELAGSS
jgi:hypothetical protein